VLQVLDATARAEVLAEARRLLASRPASRLVVVTVWAAAPPVRAALGLLARAAPSACGGLRPLDPSADLARAGLVVTQRASLRRDGYPSLVLAARTHARTC
jgi:hypothetical protein